MIYYVLCVEDGDSKMLHFNTQHEVVEFLQSFVGKYGSFDDQDSNWIQCVFYGELLDHTVSSNWKYGT